MSEPRTEPPGSGDEPPVRAIDRVPAALWVAVAAVVAAFFVGYTSTYTADVGGDLVCRHRDWADLLFAGIGAVCLVVAVVRTVRWPPERRLPAPVLLAVVVFLGGLCGYHVLTGLGRIGGPC